MIDNLSFIINNQYCTLKVGWGTWLQHWFYGENCLTFRSEDGLGSKSSVRMWMFLFLSPIQEWGVEMIYKTITLPMLSIKNFVIETPSGTSSYKQWKGVDFQIDEFDYNDYCQSKFENLLADLDWEQDAHMGMRVVWGCNLFPHIKQWELFLFFL